MKTRNIFIATTLSIFLCLPAFADTAKPNLNPDAKLPAANSPIANAALAAQIVSSMGADKDPLLLTAAAQLLRTSEKSQTKLDATKTNKGGKDDEGTKSGTDLSSEGLFAEARALAKSDKNLLAVIDTADSTSAAVSRGAVGGPKTATSRVRAYDTDTYTVEFRGDRTAEVLVVGDGDTDLDLYIFDEYGNLICSDRDGTDTMYCDFYPRWTGTFSIVIENLGRIYNEYDLLTN